MRTAVPTTVTVECFRVTDRRMSRSGYFSPCEKRDNIASIVGVVPRIVCKYRIKSRAFVPGTRTKLFIYLSCRRAIRFRRVEWHFSEHLVRRPFFIPLSLRFLFFVFGFSVPILQFTRFIPRF